MQVNDAFSGNFLKAADLKGKRIKVTIREVKMSKLDDGDKPVMSFENTDKQLVLNKTNFNRTAHATGEPDTDQWPGKAIVLMSEKTEFKGDPVDCIRVDMSEAARALNAPPRTPTSGMTSTGELARETSAGLGSPVEDPETGFIDEDGNVVPF